MPRHRLKLIALCLFATLLAGAEQSPITWSVKGGAGKPVSRGTIVNLHLAADIKPGWHLYALEEPDGGPNATEISLADGHALELGMIGAPKPEEILDPSFGVIVGFYLERAVFRLPVKILANASRGQQTVVVQVRFQTCNGRLCLAPTTVKLPVQLEIR